MSVPGIHPVRTGTHRWPESGWTLAQAEMAKFLLSCIIEETCREHGMRYPVRESVRAALGSHVRWLKQLGQPEVAEAAS